MFILGDDISIFALRTFSPSANLPALISSNKARFSSTLLFLYGLSLPGSLSVPLYSLICSAVRSSTNAFPFLIKATAASYIVSKYEDAHSFFSHLKPSQLISSSIASTYSTSSLTGFVSSYLRLHFPLYFSAVVKLTQIALACPMCR